MQIKLVEIEKAYLNRLISRLAYIIALLFFESRKDTMVHLTFDPANRRKRENLVEEMLGC